MVGTGWLWPAQAGDGLHRQAMVRTGGRFSRNIDTSDECGTYCDTVAFQKDAAAATGRDLWRTSSKALLQLSLQPPSAWASRRPPSPRPETLPSLANETITACASIHMGLWGVSFVVRNRDSSCCAMLYIRQCCPLRASRADKIGWRSGHTVLLWCQNVQSLTPVSCRCPVSVTADVCVCLP